MYLMNLDRSFCVRLFVNPRCRIPSQTSTKVSGDMHKALFLFVGFIAGVVVFDFLIGAVEILLIARPLMHLAAATWPMRMMWLKEAEEMILASGNDFLQISEVVAMRNGLLFAIRSLREYKSFMPATLFAY
eukprot:TRINITY_DN463_c0_g5_i1.p1 TRINITY_DN463_c0_g5~~TRINITY_DN463_c0_g5_i1.p1  ORF type:complete len:131 (+),score=33.89 TRINITY_DN463_c0_g5_i1:119-511(+)